MFMFRIILKQMYSVGVLEDWRCHVIFILKFNSNFNSNLTLHLMKISLFNDMFRQLKAHLHGVKAHGKLCFDLGWPAKRLPCTTLMQHLHGRCHCKVKVLHLSNYPLRQTSVQQMSCTLKSFAKPPILKPENWVLSGLAMGTIGTQPGD